MNKNGGNPRGCALGLAGARFVDHVGDCIHLYGIEIEIIAFNPVHVNAEFCQWRFIGGREIERSLKIGIGAALDAVFFR